MLTLLDCMCRDLNPSNILLAVDYRAKLGDFGLSAMLNEDDVTDDTVLSSEQVLSLLHSLAQRRVNIVPRNADSIISVR